MTSNKLGGLGSQTRLYNLGMYIVPYQRAEVMGVFYSPLAAPRERVLISNDPVMYYDKDIP